MDGQDNKLKVEQNLLTGQTGGARERKEARIAPGVWAWATGQWYHLLRWKAWARFQGGFGLFPWPY